MTDFQWPWEYTFPPFFTLQTHEETRLRQLKVWADLSLKYLKHVNKFRVNINETTFPLFCNNTLNRCLMPDAILCVMEQLQSTGHASPLDQRRVEWQVFWYTFEECGNMVYEWAQEMGYLNTVCTLYEIASGENTKNEPFYGMDEAILLNVLQLLEEKGKCEVANLDGNYGVKFF